MRISKLDDRWLIGPGKLNCVAYGVHELPSILNFTVLNFQLETFERQGFKTSLGHLKRLPGNARLAYGEKLGFFS